MPKNSSNVRNNLQRYILQIGDAISKEESLQKYEELLESLNQLAETTEEYYWKNEEGKRPALKTEDIKKIQNAYQQSIKQCNRMLTVPANELKGIQVMVDELSNLLSLDAAALDAVSKDKELDLVEILEQGRSITIDIGNQSSSVMGNQMSSRMPLHIESHDNTTKKGFFTKNTIVDPVAERDNLTSDLRRKYPEMTEIFDYIDMFDAENMVMILISNAPIAVNARIGNKLEEKAELGKQICYETWDVMLRTLDIPKNVSSKYRSQPRFPEMMMDLLDGIKKIQAQYIMYVEDQEGLNLESGSNVDKRNAAMSSVATLIGKPKLLAKSEPMILMQNGKAVSGTFMENAVGTDAYHLSNDDPMRGYGEEVYDNPEVFADIAALQALDYICGNIDRHEGNMFYQFGEVDGKQKLIGIVGIDNDMSFGMIPATTSKKMGNVWIQPEQFGVLDAMTAQSILALDKSILQSALVAYGLSEKEINAAWERTVHLQEKIVEGLDYFKDKKPGIVEPGHIRIVPSEEWYNYDRKTLATAGENQFAVLGKMQELIAKQDIENKKEKLNQDINERVMNTLFLKDKEVMKKEKTPVPLGRPKGYGTELNDTVKNSIEPVKLEVPNETELEYTSGASNKRFAFSYEDEKGNTKEVFFTEANTIELHEKIDGVIDGFLSDNPEYEDYLERVRSYYHRIAKVSDEDFSDEPVEFAELGYDEVEAEEFVKGVGAVQLITRVASKMNVLRTNIECDKSWANRTENSRIDLRNVAMSRMGDKLEVPMLLARAMPAQIRIEDSVVDGIIMERAEGIDLRNVNAGGPIKDIPDSAFDGEGLKSVAELQVLDYLCLNVDRHTDNMMYRFDGIGTDNIKFIGVQGIDNDYSFVGRNLSPEKKEMPFAVPLNKIKVITEKMAERILDMNTDDITNTLDGLTLNKKEIIATQQRLTRLQEAIQDGRIKIVKDEEWKDMKLDQLADNMNLFGEVKEALKKMQKKTKRQPKKQSKELSFKKIQRVEKFEEALLEKKEIEAHLSASKDDFEKSILDIADSEQPLIELDEKDLFILARENVRMLKEVINISDPALMRSSKEFKDMKRQCEKTAKTIKNIEKEMRRKGMVMPSAEQSQLLFENIQDLKRTAVVYDIYKNEDLGDKQPNKREQKRMDAAKEVSSVSERLCTRFRANAKMRELELQTNRSVTREIKSVINEMKKPAFDRNEYQNSFAKIIYLKTITENCEKLKKGNKLMSAMNPKAIKKGVEAIKNSESFKKFMNTSQEKLMNMLEKNNGDAFYKGFIWEQSNVDVKNKAMLKESNVSNKEIVLPQNPC